MALLRHPTREVLDSLETSRVSDLAGVQRKAIACLSELQSRNVHVWAEGGKLRFRAPHGVMTTEIEHDLRRHKAEILEFLSAAEQWRAGASQAPIDVSGARDYPLSFSQQRMWFVLQMHPDNTAYNVYTVARIRGPMKVEALDAAMTAVVNRHDALRSTFRIVDGQPRQIVGSRWDHALEFTDISDLGQPEQAAALHRIKTEEAGRVFDLENGPLLSIRLVRVSPDDHIWIENFHHLVVDDWSMRIITSEWMALYGVFKAGGRPSLPALAVQFPHFAAWQRESLQGPRLATEIEFWARELAGVLPVLQLPTDRARPAAQSFAGAQKRYRLAPALFERLTRWGAERDATLFMTLLTAYYITLYTYSGQTDIIVGSPIAGRTHPDAESLVGCCIGVIVVRVDLSDNPTCATLLERVRRACLSAYAHPDPPFEELMRVLAVPRDPRRNSIFQTMFSLLNTPIDVCHTFDDLILEITDSHNKTTKVDFALTGIEANDSLMLLADYCTDLFDGRTVDRIAGTFIQTLEAIVEDAGRRVQNLPVVDAAQRRQITSWHDVPAAPLRGDRVYRSIERQAAATPDAIAVQLEGASLTYGELDARANRLARYLISCGAGPERLTAIFLPRSIDSIVTILAVLKTGGAYLPLDTSVPPERTAFIIDDSGAAVIVTADSLRHHLAASATPIVSIDGDRRAIDACPAQSPGAIAHAENLAYVIYTSGSTGRPKGVGITHRSLSNYVERAIELYAIEAADRVLQFASVSFDAMVEEVFPCLAAGGTLVLRTDEVLSSAEAFVSACTAWSITVATLPTAFWARIVPELAASRHSVSSCTRLVILGGEEAAVSTAGLWQAGVKGRADLMNTYGPTEATVIVTGWKLASGDRASLDKVPIGTALGGVQLHILNRDLSQMPIGAPGELYIGGDALARGYLNRPDLTAESFVPNPHGTAGARLYRTGDLVRYLPDGNLEFLGRIDHQVKIRGFRVELGEIQSLLARHAAVREALVLAEPDERGHDRLVAYLVCEENPPNASQLRAFLKESLPEYMIPSAFLAVGAIPRNSSGKVDRPALAAERGTLLDSDVGFVAPRTAVEARLAELWGTVLGTREVGVFDDFYELGGHSLLIAQLLSQVKAEFGAAPSLGAFLQAPSVAGMAAALGDAARQAPPAPPIVLADEATLAPELCAGSRTWEGRPACSVFLTGATGFLGAYLAHELLCRSAATIHALVRCRDAREGSSRLRERMTGYGLWDDAFRDRIRVLPGDLAQLRFGWTPERFDEVAASVDAIYHSGAAVDMLSPYRTLKPANVGGTHEALRLASRGSLKPLHFISTLSVTAFEGRREAAPDSSSGYDQTKWVAEELVRRAGAAGLPATIFRPSAITGDSGTGACNAADFFYRFLRGCIAFGTCPDVPMFFDCAPVDFVAGRIVELSSRPSSIGRTFEVAGERPLQLDELAAHVRANGVPLRKERYDAWRARLSHADNTHPLVPLAPMFCETAQGCGDPTATGPHAAPSSPGVTSVTCPVPSRALIGTYVTYLMTHGLLDLPTRALAGSTPSR